MRALIIEDDPIVALSIELSLKAAGFAVQTTNLGEEGVDLARIYDFDAITLDLNLPDISGLEVLKRLRMAKVSTPILVVTGDQAIDTKVKTLGSGADDFLAKPFHKDELVARLHAVVRRSRGHTSARIIAGPLVLDIDAKTAEVNGARIHLTGKEYQLVELMALRKGQTITKEAVLNHLYGGMDEPEIKIVDVFVCKLRKKLATAGAEGLIHTIWGRGYALHDSAPVIGQPKPETILGMLAEEGKTFEAILTALKVSAFVLRGTLAGMKAEHLIRADDGRSDGFVEITGRGRERLRALAGGVAA